MYSIYNFKKNLEINLILLKLISKVDRWHLFILFIFRQGEDNFQFKNKTDSLENYK